MRRRKAAYIRVRIWHNYPKITLLVSGILLTFAFAPFYFLPLAIISLAMYLQQVQQAKNARQAFWFGWWFGFCHHVTALYWVSNSLLVDAAKFGWMIPFAVSLIPAILATFTGGAAVVIRWLRVQNVGINALLASSVWVAAEWLRGHMGIFAFPWNLVGYTTLVRPELAQGAFWLGVYGLSFIIVFCAFLCEKKSNYRMIAMAILVCMYLGGDKRMQPTEYTEARLLLVQPNIAQQANLSPSERFLQLQQQLEMAKGKQVDAVILNESGVPFVLNMQPDIRRVIGEALPDTIQLISGAIRVEEQEKRRDVFNSLYVLNGYGDITASYDKRILVPFGEFVPFRSVLPFLDIIADGIGDFSRGQGVRTIQPEGLPAFNPLICYEAIFSGKAVAKGENPEWLLNITNDAWFGDSIGPHQHFAMAQMRAIEEAMPLVRVAGTGISGVVDAYGRIVQKLPLGKQGVVEIRLPRKIQK